MDTVTFLYCIPKCIQSLDLYSIRCDKTLRLYWATSVPLPLMMVQPSAMAQSILQRIVIPLSSGLQSGSVQAS